MKIKKTTVKTATITKGQKGTKPASKPVASAPVEAKAGVNFGKVTGLRVMAFQDLTLKTNDAAKRPSPLAHIPGQLNDTELAKVWREEFPQSRAVVNGRINEDIVRGVRNLYNQGTQGHGIPGQTQSSKPWIINEGGKRVQTEYVRARKPKGEAKTTASAPKVEAKQVARKTAKVVAPAARKVVVRRQSKAA